ncbi:MAG: hypothetical protein AB1571_00140 [Nanoarchaeota archaeon]
MADSKTMIRGLDSIEIVIEDEHKNIIPKQITYPTKLRYYATIFSYDLPKEKVEILNSKQPDRTRAFVSNDSYIFSCMLRLELKNNYIIPVSYSFDLLKILMEKEEKRMSTRGNIIVGRNSENAFNDIDIAGGIEKFLDDYERVKGKTNVDIGDIKTFLSYTSRRQANIYVENDKFYIKNLSKNGTTRIRFPKIGLKEIEVADCNAKTKLIENGEYQACVSFGLPITDFNGIKGHSLIMVISKNELISGIKSIEYLK